VRGVISNTDIKVILSPNAVKDFGRPAIFWEGKNIKVDIVKWDEGAQAYNAELFKFDK
jgi:hypothetical protein